MSDEFCDPARWTRQLTRRPDAALPFDPASVADGAAILPDSCFYIDALKGLVSPAVAALVQTQIRQLLHSTALSAAPSWPPARRGCR